MSFSRDPEARTGPELDDPLDEVVANCLEHDPDTLEAAVVRACEGLPESAGEIRRRIDLLLSFGLLRPPSREGDERFPERLGGFRLIERLGSGAMGVVYRAQQESLGREVALKLIRPEHLYFPRARARFVRETEAAARLQHPGLVPIHTVGEEHGVPFFAMELVHGSTLANAVRELRAQNPERLDGTDLSGALQRSRPEWSRWSEAAARPAFAGNYVECVLRLSVQLADALHHAHERGVLHRDVKPSNIAVTDEARALLFDFGLAQMSDAPIRLTLSRVEIGSLAYMSPEQLGGSTNEIDRRSDVYSLGVTLYELLALRLPFAEHDPLETRRAILEGAARPLRAFNRAVPRDLELVCAKAMERDLARRYSDAAAFARDLRNVLENRPIEARAPGKLRQWSRAIRRHPVAATILAASIVLPSALLWQAAAHASELGLALEAAKRERSKAQLEARDASEVNKFLVVLFSSVSPFLARGRTVTARDLLDEGDRRLETELAEQPLLRARLLNTLGESYAGLGEWERAENLIQRALELNQRHADAESMSMVESMNALSGLESSLGRPLALEHARRAAELHRKLAHEPTSDLALTLLNYGMALADDRQSAAAEAVFRESLAVLAALAGDQRSARATVLNSLANLYDDDGRFEEALAVAREALTLQRATGKAPHPTNSSTMNAMAVALTELGRFDEARNVYDELIDEERRLTGESSIDYARCLVSKANLEHRTGRLAETIALLERAAKTFEREAPPTFPAALICRARLADSYVQAARWVDAQSLSLELAPTLEAEFTPAGRQVLMNRLRSSRCHEALGEWAALEQELNSALESARGAAENLDPDAECEAGAHLARALARRGELDGAKACMARVIELGGIAAALDSRPGAWSHLAAGVVAQCSGDAQRALQELEPLAGLDRGPAFAEAAPSIARAHLAAVLAGSDVQRARLLAASAPAELERYLGPDHPETRTAALLLQSLH